MSDLERLQEHQQDLYSKLQHFSSEIAQTLDFKSGKSQDFNIIVNKFNGNVIPFMNHLVLDCDRACSTNQVLEIKVNNLSQLIETYKSILNSYSIVFPTLMINYRQLLSTTIHLSSLYYNSLLEQEKNQRILNENKDLKNKNKALAETIIRMKGQFFSLAKTNVTVDKVQKETERLNNSIDNALQQNDKIQELEDTNLKLREKIDQLEKELEIEKENAAQTKELDDVKGELESTKMAKDMLETRVKSLRQKMMESETSHAEELEKLKQSLEETEKAKSDIEERLIKLRNATAHWKKEKEKFEGKYNELQERYTKDIEELKANVTFSDNLVENHPPPDLPHVSSIEEKEEPDGPIVDPNSEKVDLPPPNEEQQNDENEENQEEQEQEENQNGDETQDNQQNEQPAGNGEENNDNDNENSKEEESHNKEEEEIQENVEDEPEQEQEQQPEI